MPTTRRRIARPMAQVITPEAIECWRAGDYWGLHRALGLHVCQMPDWECDPPGHSNPFLPQFKQPPDPAQCKAELIVIAGPPPKRWFFKTPDGRIEFDDD